MGRELGLSWSVLSVLVNYRTRPSLVFLFILFFIFFIFQIQKILRFKKNMIQKMIKLEKYSDFEKIENCSY
jgi:predicted RND superfamily exporter protein